MNLTRMSRQELEVLNWLIGKEISALEQDVVSFAVSGADWQIKVCSVDVYRGDLANLEVSGLHVKFDTVPLQIAELPGHAFWKVFPVQVVIEEVLIVYRYWEDEWTDTHEKFILKLEGGVLLKTSGGFMLALNQAYDKAFSYPFLLFCHDSAKLSAALIEWAQHYELVTVSELIEAL